MFFLSRS
jgi:hypothetical protein